MARDDYCSIKEAAARCGVSVRTFYLWRKRGYGPKGARVFGRLRFYDRDIDEWLDQARDGKI